LSKTRTLADAIGSDMPSRMDVDDLAEVVAVLADARNALVGERLFSGLAVLSISIAFVVAAALFQVLDAVSTFTTSCACGLPSAPSMPGPSFA
jgi:hypothetical protein